MWNTIDNSYFHITKRQGFHTYSFKFIWKLRIYTFRFGAEVTDLIGDSWKLYSS